MQLHADRAITMGRGSARCYVAEMVQAWSIPDPAGRPIEDAARDSRWHRGVYPRADREERIQVIRRRLRDPVHCRARAPLLKSIRSSPNTAPEEDPRARHVNLDKFDGARVRSDIPTLSHRQTRERLR